MECNCKCNGSKKLELNLNKSLHGMSPQIYIYKEIFFNYKTTSSLSNVFFKYLKTIK